MAYVTERQSALPDAKPDPEMGFGLPMVDLWGVGQLRYGSIWYRLEATHGSGPVWPWSARYEQKKRNKKNLGKIGIFS